MLPEPLARRLLTRPVLAAGRVLPLLLAALALFLVEQSAESSPPAAGPAPGPAPVESRLVVFWVDSLSTLDMAEPGRLSRLKARLPKALHGPVRACTDAISVPCFTAASTGVDRFSLFSLARNFGGASGVAPGSVFHELQARGHKLGFIGDAQIAPAVGGFDWVEVLAHPDDPASVRLGLDAMEARDLDVVVIHLRVPDEVSHTAGPQAAEYAEAVEVVDREIEAARARLRPTDHVVVFGDHGHTPDGRHFAGLDVPTWAVFEGPVFSRALERPMAITDHAALWARVFGVRFGDVPWVDAYFAGEPLAPLAELPPLDSGNATMPAWAILACALLALAVALPARNHWRAHPGARRLAIVALAAGGAAFLLGLAYTAYRPTLYLGSPAFNAALGVGFGLLGLAFAAPVLAAGLEPGRREPAALFLAGAVCFALPTVYKFGGMYVALTALLVTLAPALVGAARARQWTSVLLLAGLAGVLSTVWDPAVRNFAVRWFPFYTEKLATVLGPATLALGALAVSMPLLLGRVERRSLWISCLFAGLTFTVAGRWLPTAVFVVPCVLALPLVLAAHRLPSLAPLAVAVALPATAFFFQWDAARVGPVAAGLAAWPLWAAARREAHVLERAVGVVVLLWLSLWTMVGCRIGGIDFQYFFQWLPPGANVEDSWASNALLTTAKYVTLPALGLLLARRVAPEAVDEALPVAWHFGRVKLALVLLFVVGFSARPTGAGPFITADVLQEAGVWVTVLLFLLPMPLYRGSGRAAVPAPASVRVPAGAGEIAA